MASKRWTCRKGLRGGNALARGYCYHFELDSRICHVAEVRALTRLHCRIMSQKLLDQWIDISVLCTHCSPNKNNFNFSRVFHFFSSTLGVLVDNLVDRRLRK